MSEDFWKGKRIRFTWLVIGIICTAILQGLWYEEKYRLKITDLEVELLETKAEAKELNKRKTDVLEQTVRLYMMEVKAENELFKEVWVKGSPKNSK